MNKYGNQISEFETNANNLRITYIKDKYGCLRCEYSGGDDYTTDLIGAVESLSYYIK